MLTEKFIKVPIKIRKISDLGDEYADDIDCWKMIDPNEISEYALMWDDDYGNAEVVEIVMKNGNSFYVYQPLKKFEAKLNEYKYGQ